MLQTLCVVTGGHVDLNPPQNSGDFAIHWIHRDPQRNCICN